MITLHDIKNIRDAVSNTNYTIDIPVLDSLLKHIDDLTVDDDTKLVKEAIELLRLQKNEIIQKRERIDTIRFWIFSTVVPAIPLFFLFFLFFHLIGLDTQGPNSYMYRDPVVARYSISIMATIMVTVVISLIVYVFQLQRDKKHYDLETDKTTSLLNDINYKIDFLEKSL